MKATDLAIIGGIIIIGIAAYKGISWIFGGIGDFFGGIGEGIGGLFGIQEERGPSEMTTEELEKIISVPEITQYDPFGIAGIMQDIARQELETRGIDIPAEEYYEYQQIKPISEISEPLDPFGISEIFVEKAQERIEEMKSPQSVVRGYPDLPVGAISTPAEEKITKIIEEQPAGTQYILEKIGFLK